MLALTQGPGVSALQPSQKGVAFPLTGAEGAETPGTVGTLGTVATVTVGTWNA